jgi:Protein of unknown function (DUF3106)
MTLLTRLAHLSRKQIAAGLLACGLVIAGVAAVAQTAPAAMASAAVKSTASKASAPDWKGLSPEQQSALKPLAANWQTMSAGQKRKWLELSKNYASIAPTEQAKLHARMSDWASLSSQQRAQARINYAENQVLTNGLTPEQRKVQWQAYQLLSPEEKKKLAANSAKTTVATAPSAKPTNLLKNAPQPQFGTAKVLGQQYAASGSKITVAPHLKKSNSILPQTTATLSATTPSSSPAVDGSAAVIKQ